jgi:outer membrane protein assembly factor BamA
MVLVTLVLLTGVAHAQNRIVEIDVRENTKTTDRTVIQISRLEIGDEWTAERGALAETELKSSNLFKHVLVAPEPGMGGIRVVIVARDKHSWVVAPTVYNQPTNKGGGLGFGENNLFGENKKLLLYGQVATGDSFFIGAYVDPAIRGSRFMWVVDVFMKSARSFEYAAPTELRESPANVRTSRLQYLNAGVIGGVTLFGDLTYHLRLRGAHVSYPKFGLSDDAEPEDVTGDPAITDIPPPGTEGWDITTIQALTWDTRSNWLGVTRGNKFRLEYERAIFQLSDFDYSLVTASAEHNHVFFKSHNLNVRGRVGRGWRLPFQAEYTSGGISLRGYKNDQFRGDMKAAANVEYSVPIVNLWGVALRLMGFADLTYTTFLATEHDTRNFLPDAEVRGMGPFRTSVGLGTRMYLKQIVIPLLGLDFGYAPETGSYEMYFAIGLTDF